MPQFCVTKRGLSLGHFPISLIGRSDPVAASPHFLC